MSQQEFDADTNIASSEELLAISMAQVQKILTLELANQNQAARVGALESQVWILTSSLQQFLSHVGSLNVDDEAEEMNVGFGGQKTWFPGLL